MTTVSAVKRRGTLAGMTMPVTTSRSGAEFRKLSHRNPDLPSAWQWMTIRPLARLSAPRACAAVPQRPAVLTSTARLRLRLLRTTNDPGGDRIRGSISRLGQADKATNGVTPGDLWRLVARLRRGEYSLFIATSYYT